MKEAFPDVVDTAGTFLMPKEETKFFELVKKLLSLFSFPPPSKKKIIIKTTYHMARCFEDHIIPRCIHLTPSLLVLDGSSFPFFYSSELLYAETKREGQTGPNGAERSHAGKPSVFTVHWYKRIHLKDALRNRTINVKCER